MQETKQELEVPTKAEGEVNDSQSVGEESSSSSSSKKETRGYRDHSQDFPENHNPAASLMAHNNSTKEPTFPAKLHSILSNPEFQDIISWLPHGRAWRILQQKAFEERVIPLYFRHGRYSSFARQVNGWGFRRVTHGSDYNSYYHELFLRGMPHLCDKMRRLTAKDIAKRKQQEELPAPDFYAFSRKHPLPESSPVPAPPSRVPGAAEIELALLERRRAAMLDRMNALTHNNVLIQQGFAPVSAPAPGGMFSFLGGGIGGLQGGAMNLDIAKLLALQQQQQQGPSGGANPNAMGMNQRFGGF